MAGSCAAALSRRSASCRARDENCVMTSPGGPVLGAEAATSGRRPIAPVCSLSRTIRTGTIVLLAAVRSVWMSPSLAKTSTASVYGGGRTASASDFLETSETTPAVLGIRTPFYAVAHCVINLQREPVKKGVPFP